MNISDLSNRKIFAVSLNIALPAALIIAFVGGSVLFFGADLTIPGAAAFALFLFILSFLIVYLISARRQRDRIHQLFNIVSEIAEKEFTDYRKIKPKEIQDELDLILSQAIRASETVSSELERLNKIENYRKEFIGDISHELKTPIFAIQGFIETLLNGAIHDKNVNELFLQKAMRNVNRLIFLTKDLMDISKLETGELKSDIREMYLRDVVLDVVESLQYKAQKEDVELRVKDFGRNIQVKADRNQIKQILYNLIENGMKYNKPGGYVEVGIKNHKKDPRKLLLYVKDTGVGIDKKDINRVTERFFRVEKSRSREKGGTGLGLAIVKHIVEAHGEVLIIESEPNLGSTFSISLTMSSPVLV